MLVAVGGYTGDGIDNTGITGVGFEPDFVLIKGNDSTNSAPICKVSAMAGDFAVEVGQSTASTTNMIQTLDADGFTIGNDEHANENGVVYKWIAIKDDGNGDFAVGTYEGDGIDDTEITGLGFDPVCVWVLRSGGSSAWRTTDNISNESMVFNGSGDATNEIQDFVTDGFEIGTNSRVNTDGVNYWWVAWKAVANAIEDGIYTGDGNDNRNITTAGFNSSYVMIKHDGIEIGRWHTTDFTTNTDAAFGNGSFSANRIQDIITNGFQVGTDADVNTLDESYRFFLFKQNAAPVGIASKRLKIGTGA